MEKKLGYVAAKTYRAMGSLKGKRKTIGYEMYSGF